MLYNFINNNYNGEIVINNRDLINKELDIYLPELNLAFEFNGTYWHNELYKSKKYHKEKSDLCDKLNIQLIHIYEDDWLYKQDIIKSMILNKLKKTPNRIFARKTEIKEIADNKTIKFFLNNNHIQGYIGSSIKLGLYYDNELVSLMTFGKLRKPLNSKSIGHEIELLRFCNKLNMSVIGGASKLFKYFLLNFNYTKITTFADRGYSNGVLYDTLGFEKTYMIKQTYKYILNGIRLHKSNFKKSTLIKEGYNKNLTEREMMLDKEIYRIYDSGLIKYTYVL